MFLLSRQTSEIKPNELKVGESANLLTSQDWSHFAGAFKTDKGLYIQPLNRAIVNQDGTPNQKNPPVNVRGPYLEVKGAFRVDYQIDPLGTNSESIFSMYGAVPVIYDEWRLETPQVQVTVAKESVSVQIWDGTSDQPVERRSWGGLNLHGKSTVKIEVTNNLDISLSGVKLGNISSHDIFKSGKVWFGADAKPGTSGWAMNNLSVMPLKGGNVQISSGAGLKVARSDKNSLRNLSNSNNRKIPIGAAVANYALFSNSDYRELVAKQFSMLTPENELKPQFVHPSPSTYSFTEADSIVDFARANNMKVHGHTLVFSEANPRWMQEASTSDRQQIMTDHINTIVKHFGGRVAEWDVVNEPLSDDDETLRNNIWYQSMGENYIDIAFRAAHASNPSAKLYINEYGLEQDGERWDNFIDLLKLLKARGVPIDGVGFQSHIYEEGDEIDASTLQAHIKTLADMGLSSRISEIDVFGDDIQNQASQYSQALKACLNSPTCTSFTTWGVTDKYGSTTELHTYPTELGNDLLWDSNLRPKPAYSALQSILKN